MRKYSYVRNVDIHITVGVMHVSPEENVERYHIYLALTSMAINAQSVGLPNLVMGG